MTSVLTLGQRTRPAATGHTQRQDEEVIAKLAEVDMMVADLERANSRVATVERRNELLRAEMETMRSGSETSEKVKALEAQISELEVEVERLNRSLETQKQTTQDTEHAWKRKVDEAVREASKKASEVDALKTRLKGYSDYDEIKRELEIMKYVEFAGLGEDPLDDEDVQLPNANAEKANVQHAKSLETLLATKNKKLLEELTKIRISHAELEASLGATENHLKSTASELEKQKELNNKLEDDLLSVNNQPNGDVGSSGSPSRAGSTDALASLDLGRKKESDGPIRTSILPIVTSQRDRFRQRNAELEEELRKQFQIISDLRAEIKNLQADNLKLYEKLATAHIAAGSSTVGFTVGSRTFVVVDGGFWS
ncbi:CASP C terminal-domain-containing protein [Flagelloscypha sp. PMI_526]|nr:CASP C terminal-domain-containing protein [Flagelloscypha sp. PMI_526]